MCLQQEEFRNLFRYYLYGYLNYYYADLYFIGKSGNTISHYKHYKIRSLFNYLNINEKYYLLLKVLFLVLEKFEILISIFFVFAQFCRCIIKFLFSKRIKIKETKLVIGIIKQKSDYSKYLNYVNAKDAVIVKMPSSTPNLDNFKSVSLLSGVTFYDMLKAFKASIKMVFFIKKKYGYRDFFFRSYSSFDFFLTCFFLKNTDESNSFYFTNTIDRWAFLFGNTSHKTVFIQHGILLKQCRVVKKTGRVDDACYINEEQKDVCEDLLFYNKPKYSYRPLMQFTSNDKLLRNNRKDILLVCNSLFIEKEKEIIEFLSHLQINLYIKPHPQDKIDIYQSIIREKHYILLEKSDYPKMDIVISYESTLANEYEDVGASVIRHSDPLFNDKLKQLFS